METLSPLTLRKMDRSMASRQKSCNSCVRGKRKCDKKAPRCTRCAAKGLDCIYHRTPPGATPLFQDDEDNDNDLDASVNANVNIGMDVSGGQVSEAPGMIDMDSSDMMPEFDMGGFGIDPRLNSHNNSSNNHNIDLDVNLGASTHSNNTYNNTRTNSEADSAPTMSSTSGSTSATPSSLTDVSFDFSIIDMLSQDASPDGVSSDLWSLPMGLMTAPSSNKMDIPPVPSSQPLVLRDVSMLADVRNCAAFNPIDVHDPATRVGFVVNALTDMNREFAATRALPFIHPRLYGSSLPRPMMAVFAAVAAYQARTPQNRGWVYKLIADSARDIHCEGERAATPQEKIARVQALLVLDTVRVFDGDLALRAAAEDELPQLLSWVGVLNELRAELEAGMTMQDLMSRDRPPETWESWVLLESIRRTSTTAFALICITYLLKSREPPMQCMDTKMVFTASKYLWEAGSSVAFYNAWQSRPQYAVDMMNFDELWMHGNPEDIDDFTKLLMTSSIGPEKMEYFMSGAANQQQCSV